MNEPGLEKAMDTLQYLSQDSEARRLYKARQKYLLDEASMLEGARQAGSCLPLIVRYIPKLISHLKNKVAPECSFAVVALS